VSAKPQILLVDDEVAIQRTVAPLLRGRGYDVRVASTGAAPPHRAEGGSAARLKNRTSVPPAPG
jgi:CheY-like chemotaxis protein